MSSTLEALRATLRSSPQYSELRSKIEKQLSSNAQHPGSPDSLDMGALLASLMSASPSSSSSSLTPPAAPLDPTLVYLKVSVGKGSAFVAHLAANNSPASRLSDVTLSLAFKGARFCTPPTRVRMDPAFSGTFLFPLTTAATTPSDSNGWYDLLTSDTSRLHLVCTSAVTPAKDTHASYSRITRELVSSGSVDWRSALLSDSGRTMVELSACSTNGFSSPHKNSGGAVLLTMELVQAKTSLTLPLTTEDIDRHVAASEQAAVEHARDFYLYARDWWRAFQEISPIHAARSGVRNFAEDEVGTNRAVCSYVDPVRCGRLIDSPRHAARFVSLLPFERQAGVGGRRIDSWQSWHAFLSRGRGDVEDHATLLCSLLLGFGLNTYVCIGQAYDDAAEDHDARDKVTREHAWVVTVASSGDVTFIESLTGQRYEVPKGTRAPADLPYASVSCAFNNSSFYANKNSDDSVSETVWDFSNMRFWKGMDREAIAIAPRAVSACATLMPSTLGVDVAEALEQEMMALIKQKREDLYGLSAIFDEELAYLLQPAVAAYENERLTGYSFGSADFQNAVKNAVPERNCFKGLPLCFAHMDAPKILAGIEGSDVGSDIIKTRGDQVRFALRVRCYVYPENTLAVWVMLAVRYLPKN
jgi:centrosomal protein CEP76